MTFECNRDVMADAQDTIDALRARRGENRDEYEAATANGRATLSGVDEYLGLPLLVVPFQSYDDGERPLPGRPEGAVPLRSHGLAVTEPRSDDVGRLSPETTYELTAEIRNDGDMDVPPTIVEFFANHRPWETHYDATNNYVQVAKSSNQTVTGWSTLEPGSSFAATLMSNERRPLQVAYPTVQADRTFSFEMDFSGYDMGNVGYFESPDGQDDPAKVLVTSSPSHEPEPMDLSVVTAEAEFVGMQRARVPSGRIAEVSIQYTTPEKTDQQLGEFFVRAYSIVPLDAPDTWGTLDHREDRHVGRTEVFWA